jgi:hypothetical protein
MLQDSPSPRLLSQSGERVSAKMSKEKLRLNWQNAEKDPAHRLLKNAQIQGGRNPEE